MLEEINFSCEFDKAKQVFTNMIYNGYTIEQISNLYKLSTYRVIDNLLFKNNTDINVLNAIKDYYNSLKINEHKCLVISDTHIGRLSSDENIHTYNMAMNSNCILKNEVGLYNAYNYAIKNNIRNIIHAGDLIEGNCDMYSYKLHPDLQFIYTKEKYPNINGINTYFIYGNHDFNIIYYHGRKDEEFKMNDNLKLIGLNYSYISFNNNLIKVSHECNASRFYRNIDLPYDFEIAGHSHIFTLDEEFRFIKAPTLSSVYSDSTGKGFLELIDEENEYVFKFLDDNTNLKYEKVLSKKINNSYN